MVRKATVSRFGIVHVDFKTLKRTPKASFAYLAEVVRGHG